MMILCSPQNPEEETFVKLVRIAKITYSLNHPKFLKDTNIDNGDKKKENLLCNIRQREKIYRRRAVLKMSWLIVVKVNCRDYSLNKIKH